MDSFVPFMSTLGAVLWMFGILLSAMTLVSLFRIDSWWARIWDFPRAQILVLLTIELVLISLYFDTLGMGGSVLLAAVLLSVLYQGYMMFPYTLLGAKQVQRTRRVIPENRAKLLFANVLMTNRNSEALRRLIYQVDPDIILTAETDNWWAEQLAEFESSHPFKVLCPLENTYGMTLYSRLELVDPTLKYLVEQDIPSIHTTVRLRSGVTFELRCLHPRPPFPTEDETATSRDAELLIVGRETKIKNEPFVVMGDLNDVAWSRTNYLFQDISGLLDPRVGRGFYNTFHARYPFFRFPLDHFFVSNHFRLVSFRRLPYFGSDHFPVFIELSYEHDATLYQEELVAEPEQVREAIEKIEKALND